jgi:uncharacterized protein DUF1559
VQKVREASARTQCQNNIKQIIIGLHNYHSTQNKFPPGYSNDAVNGTGTVFWHVLPFIEQDNVYKVGMTLPINTNPQPDAYWNNFASTNPLTPAAYEIKIYLCPSDPNNQPSATWGGGWVVGNYAYNHDAFGEALDGGNNTNVQTRMPGHFKDGTSNTIGIAEKYAKNCVANPNGQGSLWAHGSWNPWWEPRFNSWAYRYSGNATAAFQIQPLPNQCDAARLQTIHTGGMTMGMMDGSVRFTASSVSGPTLSAACTPRNDDVITDW